jgi:hypothetical protein
MNPTSETIMLAVFLRHDQSQNLDQLQRTLAERNWWERFPLIGASERG